MKTKLPLIALLISVCLSATSAQDFRLPPSSDLFQYSVPEGSVYGYSQPYKRIYGFPEVRIWGWSESGTVAYSVERFIEGRGGIVVSYIVFDLIEDKPLWILQMDSIYYEDVNEPSFLFASFTDEKQDTSFLYFTYDLRKQEIEEAFNKHGIIRHYINDYYKLPIQFNDRIYYCTASIVYEEEPQFYDFIRSYTITVETGGKMKTVAEVEETDALSLYLCGYFISPFENRAVIITAEERFGWEGSELFYFFVGCDLERRFE
ncbi:hypothetical protein K7I13_12470 [Brucepastera parasyntrophica]|uniref:hypothetical protein n=1 Tax=Brucepastera parasyntrophica TaxID=2880008 RepID=UPI00210D1B82|nr:hypothetical protein [Brucepastera parasyntrophica]ULQ59296.1 hypothetical protein K7I13_12470 [Brucepastera parasyntrophica]